MKLALTPRRVFLGVSLVASIAGAFSVSGEGGDESVVGAAAPHARGNANGAEKVDPVAGGDGMPAELGSTADMHAHANGEHVALVKLVPRHFVTTGDDLFSVPAALRPQKLVDVKPVAPALPFKFLGRITDGERVAVLLSTSGSDTVVAHEGDAVGNSYRLETVGADALTFVYLPLQQKQTLALGDAPADSSFTVLPPVDSPPATSQKNAKR